jgi:hypothetical protein
VTSFITILKNTIIYMTTTKFLPVLLIAAGMFIACGGGEQKETSTTPAENGSQLLAEVDTVHAYICPMHCENSAQMEPGVCKVCGMDLVKNPDYKGEAVNTAPAPDSTATPETEKEDGTRGG